MQEGSPERTPASAATATAGRRAPSRLWWVYFGYLLVLLAIGFVPYVSMLRTEPPRRLALATVATLLNLWGLVGLWGYIRSLRLGSPWLWRLCFLLTTAQFAFSGYQFAKVLRYGIGGLETTVAIVGLCSLLLGVPLLVALWLYAFRTPERRRQAAQGAEA